MSHRVALCAVLAVVAPAGAVTVRCADALALELTDRGTISDLSLDSRPAPLAGEGGWTLEDQAAGVDETFYFGLSATWDETDPDGRVWRLGTGWDLGDEQFNGDRVAIARDPAGGTPGHLRARFPAVAEAAYSLRLFVRREAFVGRARLAVLPLDAVGRAAGPLGELRPQPAAAGGWGEARATIVAPPAAAWLELIVSLEGASGGFAVGGLAVTYHGAGVRHAVAGTVAPDGDGARFTGEAAGLRLDARYRPVGRHLLLEAGLEAVDGGEHAVTLTFTVPVAGAGWEWWHDLRRPEPVPESGGRLFADWLPLGDGQRVSPYPLGCVTRRAPAMAVSLATPLSQPVLTRHGYRQGTGLFVAFDLGLLPRLGKRRVELRLALLAPNAAWGLRGALEGAYELFDQDTVGRATRAGAWFTALHPQAVPDPATYGLLYDEQAAAHVEWSRAHELVGLTAILPWGVYHRAGGELPDAADGLYPVRRTEAPPGEGRLIDARGEPVTFPLDDGGAFTPWWTDPELVPDGPAATINASLASALQAPDGQPLGGLVVDGLGAAWAGWQLDDHHGDHLALTDAPLSFSRATREPVAYSALGHLDLLAQLHRRLHADGRLLLGVLEPEAPLPFLAPWLDVLGGGERIPPESFLMWLRVMAYHKPVTFLDATILDPTVLASAQHEVWQRAVLWGAFPGAAGWWSERNLSLHRPFFEVYVPLLRSLAAAGWEPVPHAFLSDADVELERYGYRDELYFVIRNRTDTTRNLVLTLYPQELGLVTEGAGGRIEARRLFVDLLSRTRRPYELRQANDRWQLSFVLPPRALMALTPYKVDTGFGLLGDFNLLPEPPP